ncbi:restriction endonuclease subunit S [Megamonas funiformis]|uniref:restriction endonuclease subunit S n=1 Tax=Megamonas funiformis TaxID=437897 RepID=UPI00242FB252|nr:restriction endonuclease subunit S [Megamonas funiformis]
MAKKKQIELTIEEKLQNALVPKEEQPYKIPNNWCWTYLTKGMAECWDKYRKPINATERNKRLGNIPYYGATGQVGWIDDYLTDEHLVLIGEDGAPFLDLLKNKAYIIKGKSWVNNHAHILKSFYDEVGNKYLCNYLNVFNYKGYINGTTRLKLTQKNLDIIPIPLPPINEQQRIVERIESLFVKLDRAKELIENTLAQFEQNKMAILHKAFTGELTARWRKENNINEKNFFNKVKLKNVIKLISGRDVSVSLCNDKSIGIPYILGASNIKDNKFFIERWIENPVVVSEKNDILLSVKGTIGKLYLQKEEKINISRQIMALRALNELNTHYLYYFLLRECERLKFEGNGLIPGISRKDILDLNILLPTLEEQQEIVNILDKLLAKYNKIKNLEQQLEKIELLKKAILAKAFRGELGTNNPDEESAENLLKEILAEK